MGLLVEDNIGERPDTEPRISVGVPTIGTTSVGVIPVGAIAVGVTPIGVTPVWVASGCVSKVGIRRDSGVSVGTGLSKYTSVCAMAVRVLLEYVTAASLAGPPEATQIRSSKAMNSPVTANACK